MKEGCFRNTIHDREKIKHEENSIMRPKNDEIEQMPSPSIAMSGSASTHNGTIRFQP